VSTVDPAQLAIADVLDSAAAEIDRLPGTNVLDALRSAHLAHGSDDTRIGETYYQLLGYLPHHVEYLAPWSDAETPDRVASKLRQFARTLRKGGPHRVEEHGPPPRAAPADAELVGVAASHNRGAHLRPGARAGHHHRKPISEWPRDAQLRQRVGHLQSALVRMRRGKHPNPTKITAAELELAEVQRELAELNGDPPPNGDAAALALIGESHAFPPERDPTTNGRQPAMAGTWSGL